MVSRLRTNDQDGDGVSPTQKIEAAMSKENFPEGWDENKTQRVLAYYEQQSEEDALIEDEAGAGYFRSATGACKGEA